MSDFMVFGYARVSTENQIENYSIDEQTERIKSYCQAKGWNLLRTYVDGGYSGGNMDRPALQEMLQAVRKREADAVVVYKLDRLSRSQKDTLTLIEDEFLAHDTDFISINENFDTSTPFGKAMIGILSVFSQLEKDQITERFTMGRIGRSKAGYYHGGPTPPTGYDYINGDLIVNPLEADKVHQIFDAFTSGASINSISQQMKKQYGGSWSAAKISNILKNSTYIGKVKFKGVAYEGKHQPIIRKNQFEQVQRMLEKRPAPLKQPFRAEYLLSGILYCAKCGAKYSANHGYYKCYSRAKSCKRLIKDPTCKNDNWKIEELDRQVAAYVKAICSGRNKLKKLQSEEPPNQNDMIVKKRISVLNKQMEHLVELYQISAIPMETIRSKIQEIQIEKIALNEKLQKKAGQLPSLQDRAKTFPENFDSSSLEAQRVLIDAIIERIDISGKDISIKFRI